MEAGCRTGAAGRGEQIEELQPADGNAGDGDGPSLGRAIWFAALAAAAVIAAGSALAFSADALAEQTGLGAGFVGLLFGGIATSLPELSTTVSAVRLKQYEMTFSDAFGTNLSSLGLWFVADVLYVGGPILREVGASRPSPCCWAPP